MWSTFHYVPQNQSINCPMKATVLHPTIQLVSTFHKVEDNLKCILIIQISKCRKECRKVFTITSENGSKCKFIHHAPLSQNWLLEFSTREVDYRMWHVNNMCNIYNLIQNSDTSEHTVYMGHVQIMIARARFTLSVSVNAASFLAMSLKLKLLRLPDTPSKSLQKWVATQTLRIGLFFCIFLNDFKTWVVLCKTEKIFSWWNLILKLVFIENLQNYLLFFLTFGYYLASFYFGFKFVDGAIFVHRKCEHCLDWTFLIVFVLQGWVHVRNESADVYVNINWLQRNWGMRKQNDRLK